VKELFKIGFKIGFSLMVIGGLCFLFCMFFGLMNNTPPGRVTFVCAGAFAIGLVFSVTAMLALMWTE
jgi:hypothetical protein